MKNIILLLACLSSFPTHILAQDDTVNELMGQSSVGTTVHTGTTQQILSWQQRGTDLLLHTTGGILCLRPYQTGILHVSFGKPRNYREAVTLLHKNLPPLIFKYVKTRTTSSYQLHNSKLLSIKNKDTLPSTTRRDDSSFLNHPPSHVPVPYLIPSHLAVISVFHRTKPSMVWGSIVTDI